MSAPNLVLNGKTYTFDSDVSGVITWSDKTGGIPAGFSKVTASLRPSAKSTSPYRVDLRIDIPILAAEDSSCACTGEVLRWETGRISVEIPFTGTTAERTDAATRLKDLIADATVQAMLISLTRP